MKLELYLQNSNTGKVYDISQISEEISVYSTIEGEAGKLTCLLQKDPNNILEISNGSIISFIVDGKGFFFGYVFKMGTDADENYQITAYDQMRYLKNNDIYVTRNQTASNIFKKICQDKGLKYKIKVPTKYIPEAYLHDNKTLYNIIERGMNLASIYDKKRYFIKDNFGTLTWSELQEEKTNIQLGDSSLVNSYTYEKSIDQDVYNQIKLYRDQKTTAKSKNGSEKKTKTGKREVWIVKDSNNIKRWGLLQLLKKVDDNDNEAKIKEQAKNYLTAKNREVETLKLEADGIIELVAGRGIKFVLKREGIDKWMWIKSATHKFTKYSHTMELEVEI